MTALWKNLENLELSPLRQKALDIVSAGLRAVNTQTVIHEEVSYKEGTLKIRDLKISLDGGRLIVITIGKCALDAGMALEEILGDRISSGVVLDIRPGKLKKLKTFLGTHPFPSVANREATARISKELEGLTPEDVVLFVVSGGGSTLLSESQILSSEEERKIVEDFFRAGATIKEMNLVRKHLSSARGGFLAKKAYPAQVVSLIFSDIPGDDISFVASGPTVRDESTKADALGLLKKYDIEHYLSSKIEALFETPKEKKYFDKVHNILLVSNSLALRAMSLKATSLGFEAHLVTSRLEGEASRLGPELAVNIAKSAPRTALLYGGETTVKVQGQGRGGRNQELVLSAFPFVADDTLLLSLASDGHDNSDHAGAWCDIIAKEKARQMRLDPSRYLAENDSYAFFKKAKDALVTENTGVNVSDLIVALHA